MRVDVGGIVDNDDTNDTDDTDDVGTIVAVAACDTGASRGARVTANPTSSNRASSSSAPPGRIDGGHGGGSSGGGDGGGGGGDFPRGGDEVGEQRLPAALRCPPATVCALIGLYGYVPLPLLPLVLLLPLPPRSKPSSPTAPLSPLFFAAFRLASHDLVLADGGITVVVHHLGTVVAEPSPRLAGTYRRVVVYLGRT